MSRPKPYSAQSKRSGEVPAPEWICYKEADGEFGTDFYVKLWEPGDGLHCSHATKGRQFECGAPVAVTKEVKRKDRLIGSASSRPYYLDSHRKYVVCADHLAVHFSGVTVGELSAESERSAREQIITNHWDEYQQALKSQRERLRDRALGELPQIIRDAISGGAA
ncbi:hypothetical protein SEA_MODRAGONS_50 [Mycobacterium phage Modragons]|uniref:Uncharacterized protein n=1 Tax=Mycobacterium phage Ochi17 TaxID=2502425 RepID=A0A411BTG9_9CAUD|nr:hypothetical protein PBI_LLAMA_51 [Mycobacterium phage Llama]YP_010101063.1 hypothetical protein KNU45_gp049 [Mycobacterium phage Ochi17]QFP96434.1 hypothetical protein SEA_MODRAGONS_50 [Mycobacterium phage Modragons]QOP67134.1 hypothetical protein SEA_SEABASTIAN_51 [Mycobacterium phage Seabastian]QOP67245.1 hypothetical protein SEA_OFULTRON_51 [Mycobacterium phage OfUltron]WNM64870.1 hypothetical protein SEA_ALPINESIX_51 [Mycobacterium phage AlpineSix]AIM50993.1 hypothetical protein PBI_L